TTAAGRAPGPGRQNPVRASRRRAGPGFRAASPPACGPPPFRSIRNRIRNGTLRRLYAGWANVRKMFIAGVFPETAGQTTCYLVVTASVAPRNGLTILGLVHTERAA